jgi:hypothetical protein
MERIVRIYNAGVVNSDRRIGFVGEMPRRFRVQCCRIKRWGIFVLFEKKIINPRRSRLHTFCSDIYSNESKLVLCPDVVH